MGLSKDEMLELRRQHGEILDAKETYGEGEPQSQARQFWMDKLADPIIERAREKLERAGSLPNVGLLVSVAGYSPETTMVTASVLRPQQVLVISSGDPYSQIDIIAAFLTRRGLRATQFHHERCDTSDLSIYDVIRRGVKTYGSVRAGGAALVGETLIDITGGKKVMSAVAATAAWDLGLRIVYLDNSYDERRRNARPGTEGIVLLDSPQLLYGGGDQLRADHNFNMGAYEAARTVYDELADRLSEPERVRFLRDLSNFYEAWRNLDIERLREAMPRVRKRLALPGELARIHRAKLDAQLGFVERLIADERPAKIMTLFLLGGAHMEAGRYDFSSLLFYRTIEASIASRLEQRYPEFLCEAPDYARIDADTEALRARYEAIARELLPAQDTYKLPRTVGCLDGAMLLLAQNDLLLEKANFGNPKALGRMRDVTTARNRSILAHGYRSVTKQNCQDLREPAEQMLSAYWTLNEEPVPFKKAIHNLRFVKTEA